MWKFPGYIDRLLHGGPKPIRTFAERALRMSDAYAIFMEESKKIEADIAEKKADIAAAHARISALHTGPQT